MFHLHLKVPENVSPQSTRKCLTAHWSRRQYITKSQCTRKCLTCPGNVLSVPQSKRKCPIGAMLFRPWPMCPRTFCQGTHRPMKNVLEHLGRGQSVIASFHPSLKLLINVSPVFFGIQEDVSSVPRSNRRKLLPVLKVLYLSHETLENVSKFSEKCLKMSHLPLKVPEDVVWRGGGLHPAGDGVSWPSVHKHFALPFNHGPGNWTRQN